MILSIHLAELAPRAALSVLRGRLRAPDVPGLVWARTAATVPLGTGPFSPPRPDGVGLIAAWTGDAALDEFLAHHVLAGRIAAGWHVRLEPLRASGAWSSLPGLGDPEHPVEDEEPVAVLTLGRLRLRRAIPFLRTSDPAERQAVADPATLLSTGLARPPHLVATFSVWRTAAAMRAYAYGASGEAHVNAIRAHAARPFHHESLFARFRPYGSRGAWHGNDVL